MKITLGSEAMEGGKLKGATDTEYFYFFCPKCPDNQILRILDFEIVRDEAENTYNSESQSVAARSFVIRFDLACDVCGLRDCTKVSNIGWQGGAYATALRL
jgi:hypothetical protein